MSQRTLFLARLIGIYCLLAALMMLVQGDALVATVSATLHQGPFLLLLGTLDAAVTFLIGAWLTYAGFRRTASGA
jgi:hypothetical protein